MVAELDHGWNEKRCTSWGLYIFRSLGLWCEGLTLSWSEIMCEHFKGGCGDFKYSKNISVYRYLL